MKKKENNCQAKKIKIWSNTKTECNLNLSSSLSSIINRAASYVQQALHESRCAVRHNHGARGHNCVLLSSCTYWIPSAIVPHCFVSFCSTFLSDPRSFRIVDSTRIDTIGRWREGGGGPSCPHVSNTLLGDLWHRQRFLYCLIQFVSCKSLQWDLLCGLVVRVPSYRSEMYCVSCEVRTEFMYVM
jgi:hypothetical protein